MQRKLTVKCTWKTDKMNTFASKQSVIYLRSSFKIGGINTNQNYLMFEVQGMLAVPLNPQL